MCNKCKGPLIDIVDGDSELTCDTCKNKCSRCSKSIDGSSVDLPTMGKKFHNECFTCVSCSRSLSDDFYSVNNDPCCESCAASMLS